MQEHFVKYFVNKKRSPLSCHN